MANQLIFTVQMIFFFETREAGWLFQALRLEARKVKESQVHHGYMDETLPKVPVVYNACPGVQDVKKGHIP